LNFISLERRTDELKDSCDYLYGIWNGSSGGTKNCLDYAREKGVQTYVDDPTPWIEEYRSQQACQWKNGKV